MYMFYTTIAITTLTCCNAVCYTSAEGDGFKFNINSNFTIENLIQNKIPRTRVIEITQDGFIYISSGAAIAYSHKNCAQNASWSSGNISGYTLDEYEFSCEKAEANLYIVTFKLNGSEVHRSFLEDQDGYIVLSSIEFPVTGGGLGLYHPDRFALAYSKDCINSSEELAAHDCFSQVPAMNLISIPEDAL